MKILQVAHSFVPYTMAGTEVYSYKLSKELAKRHEVSVFFRINDRKKEEYSVIYRNYEGLHTYAINNTFRLCNSFRETFRNGIIDKKFGELLDKVKPDAVHIHHLLFLSCGIIDEIKKRKIPVLYTLHDYWLICYRGQLLKDDLSICSGSSALGCGDCLKYLLSIRKYSMYFYGIFKKSLAPFLLQILKKLYFSLANKQSSPGPMDFEKSVRELIPKIDLFIAPSNFIRNKFIENGFPETKMIYSPYGFDLRGPAYAKEPSQDLRFGYIGTLLPPKGTDLLMAAFKELQYKNVTLSVYGRLLAYSGFEYYPKLLKKLARFDDRIKLKGSFDNNDVAKILQDIDLLVVPSIWQENSPLVIQEAFLSGTPVLASDIGGIPELINDGVNGLLFRPKDASDLRSKMQYVVDNPKILEKFRQNMPKAKSIEENAKELEGFYFNR